MKSKIQDVLEEVLTIYFPLASFDMRIPVDGLFFCNNQLVAISNTGKVAVWQGVQRHWQVIIFACLYTRDFVSFHLV